MGKPKERRPLEIPKRRFKDNTKMDVHGMGWKTWGGLIWLRIGTDGGLL